MSRRFAAALIGGALAMLTLAPTASATFPGHNGRLAFQVETDSGLQIFTMRPNGHDLRQLTHVDGNAALADWSPDGRQLTFTLNDCTIAFIDADGENLRVLPPAPGDGTPGVDVCDGDSSYTPDGERVVYDHYNAVLDKEDIRSMRLDGSDRVLVTDAGGPDPNVSPDGDRISFKGGPVGALFTSRLDGTELTQVSPSVSVSYKADWAPNGKHLVFSDNSEPGPLDNVNIATVRPDGTGLHYITHFTDAGLYANVGGYSPDGHWIVFRLSDHGMYALYVVGPAGQGLHRITPWSTFLARFIDWGPEPN
jgi:Tol biopolymer transport system component